MILNDKIGNIENNTGISGNEFTISANSKMFDILSNKIYEDPITAIVRELSTNAIDAHLEAGNDKPFQVSLPVPGASTFIIEDQGIGMSNEDVMVVYRSYGKSTKSHTNDVIGALGLGGKTPLAYTSQFVLTTAKDGIENQYVIFKDENGIPNVTHVTEKEADYSGTKVEVIVREQDASDFIFAAIKTFVFFDKMPEIIRGKERFYDVMIHRIYGSYSSLKQDEIMDLYNEARHLAKTDFTSGSHSNCKILTGILSNLGSSFGVIMGQIFYKVNINQLLKLEGYDSDDVFTLINFPYRWDAYKIKHVPLGSVSIQPSREALNYNKDTINFLQQVFLKDVKDWEQEVQEKLSNKDEFFKNFDSLSYKEALVNFTRGRISSLNYIEKEYFTEAAKLFRTSIDVKNISTIARREFRSSIAYNMNILEKNIGTSEYSSKEEDLTISLLYTFLMNEANQKAIILDDKTIEAKVAATVEELEASYKLLRGNSDSKRVPIVLRNKLRAHFEDKKIPFKEAFLIKEDQKEIFEKFFPKMTFVRLSEIKVPKVERKKVQNTSIKGAQVYEYDAELKTFLKVNNSGIKNLLKQKKVVYECFDGDFQSEEHGQLWKPNWEELQKKVTKGHGRTILVSGKGVVQSHIMLKKILGRMCVCRKFLKLPKKYVVINWDFFKENSIHLNKNWVYANNYFMTMLEDQFEDIKAALTESIWHKNSLFNAYNAKNFLNVAMDLGCSDRFAKTSFKKECDRIIYEDENVKQTDLDKIRTMYNQLTTVVGWVKEQNEGLYNDLSLIKYTDKKIEDFSYADALLEKYPMLDFVSFSSYGINRSSYQKIIEYVMGVEQC